MSEHHDPMVSASEDDFTNFLDLGDFQLNFPPFDSEGQHTTARQDGSHAMDMSYDEAGDGGVAAKESHMHQQQQQEQQQRRQSLNGHQIHSAMAMQNMDQTSAEVVLGLNAQINYLQLRQQQQQDYHQRTVIPPTPDSVDMHAGAARYYQQIDHQTLAYLQQQRLKEDQQVLTLPRVLELGSSISSRH
jgi:hypothetical protein